jgi:hypothetical protein
VAAWEGSLTLTNSTVSGNTGGGGVFGSYTCMGLNSSTISNNAGFGVKGNFFYCRFNSTSSAFSSNSGIGVIIDEIGSNTPHTLVNSTISGNGGSGLRIDSTNLTINKSTISGNASHGLDVSGVSNYLPYGSTLTNSTISGNGGSGVRAAASTLTITNSTIANNAHDGVGAYHGSPSDPSTITLARALISGNARLSGNEVYCSGYSTVTTSNNNLFGHSGRATYGDNGALFGIGPGASDITATSDGSRPTALSGIINTALGANGGPTRTHALPAASPAVDAATNSPCPPPAQDQRSINRPRDGNGDGGAACDVGSFER